ncbi:hypothetical protein LJY25_00730 [Hymenobacter sp. BT175]|uniref:hypothetical protein n=1 Tax=Hymenobacter translucens TaxID=2886507 RepID=UPI001D0F3EAC|nr:hypothetical protein [Hymenobacter translucens]MCC2544953.1 hypothetical protein [Hymenobacter translucens]
MELNLSSATKSTSEKTVITAVNSTLLFLLAYLLVHGVFQLATVYTAADLDIPGVLHLSRVEFLITDQQWWREAVLAVFGAGPLACTVVSIAAALWFWKRQRQQRGLFKLFLFWVSVHACNLVLGGTIAGTLTQSGFYYIPTYILLLGNTPSVLLSLLSGILAIALGYFAAIGFLQCHDSKTLMRFDNRSKLIVFNIVVPWLVSSAVLTLLKWPDITMHELLTYATLSLLLGPMAIASTTEIFSTTVVQPQKTQLALGVAVVAVVVLIAWRLVLSPGVAFR